MLLTRREAMAGCGGGLALMAGVPALGTGGLSQPDHHG